MILPAGIFKIEGFVDLKDMSIKDEPQDGNLLVVLADSGKRVALKMTGNKTPLTTEDVKTYFDAKTKSVIKRKELEGCAAELEDVDEYADALEDAVDEFKENSETKPTSKEVREFKKEWKSKVAEEIVYNRRRIKKGSIMRMATSFSSEPNKVDKIKIDGEVLNIVESRCIIFDLNDNTPTPTGMYYFSQTANQLPISIKPIFNKDNEPIQLFTLELSHLARFEHFEYLTHHMIRTLDTVFNKDGKCFLSRFNFDYHSVKHLPVFNLLKEFNELAKNKELTEASDVEKAKELYISILKEVDSNQELVKYVHIQLNLMINPEYFKKIEDSPFSKFDINTVNLNFSKLDPEDKNFLKDIGAKYKEELMNGLKPFILSAVYQVPALRLGEEPDSWGFMHDNIQSRTFVLDSRTTALHIKNLEKQ